jgi:hypothetical protein
MSDREVECLIHGRSTEAFVCRHIVASLRNGVRTGFHTPGDSESENQAWCHACEQVRACEGEWNDRSEAYAGIRLICDRCYDRARQLNLGF